MLHLGNGLTSNSYSPHYIFLLLHLLNQDALFLFFLDYFAPVHGLPGSEPFTESLVDFPGGVEPVHLAAEPLELAGIALHVPLIHA